MACRRAGGVFGRPGVGGTRRGAAQGRRQLQLSARGLWSAICRTLAFVPHGLADHVFGAAVGRERQYRVCELPALSGARAAGLGRASRGRTFPPAAGRAALSANRDHRQNVGGAGVWRAHRMPLDCTLGHPAPERGPPLRFSPRGLSPQLDFLGGARPRHALRAVRLLRLLQRVLPRRGNPRSGARDSPRHHVLDHHRGRALRLHDFCIPERHSLASDSGQQVHRFHLCRGALRAGGGKIDDRAGALDCFFLGLLVAARLLAHPLRGGDGRQLLPRFRPASS